MPYDEQKAVYTFGKGGYSVDLDPCSFGPVQLAAMATPRPRPDSILQAAAATFLAKNAEYGDNYLRFPRALLALFPGGKIPEISTEADASRLQLLIQILNKMTRYAETFSVGGHRDSARDIIVYAAMLEEQTK